MADGDSRDDIADFLTAWKLSQYINTFQGKFNKIINWNKCMVCMDNT